ncbi:putative LuxR family transcriptional regulator [Gordonia effusa NBRC 100432]|uniref:Putative LuxR family transcriptional regulator n=1 Tax=Gordonia effusa NBRC 100432 TaxID=1077974 RepID=H0R438_9ACTN|nr:LuxR C-terminal-related transcriptional regulator [Gordonia effusa]GAB19839.1 putative LuxR family transcriptional regulator [Gordonia effusa NBRC 100432]
MTVSVEHAASNTTSNVVALPLSGRARTDVLAIEDIVVVRRIPRPALSAREIEVLLAWLVTESKRDAAKALFISSATVSTHVSRIRDKYAEVGRPAPTKAHLLIRALQDGFTSIEDW